MGRLVSLIVALGVVLILSGTLAAPAGADPPEHQTGGVGGTFPNPCTGNLFSFEAEGLGVLGSTSQVFVAHGSGVDQGTGKEYSVTWQSTQTSAPDESGFTLHIGIVARAGPDTFVVSGVAVANTRPDAPVELNFVTLTCAGQGEVPL